MIEKLLENWLDSASERSYQAVFVQMLAAEGYTVLHSTRHCLLEFGKDILAVAPDGVGCAFQLKGDARGRMTISHFRSEIQGQLLQLASQTPAYPGFPQGVHRSYLVSNGQFEEEVQTAVAQMNAGPIPSKIELWSRGKLLELCQKHGVSLWPSELADNRALLELYLSPPRAQLPIETLCGMLESVLKLGENDALLSERELERATASATWLTGISTFTFAEADNHQAVAYAWTICCVVLVAAWLRHGRQRTRQLEMALELSEAALLDALTAHWEEIESRQSLVEGEPLTDSLIHQWRIATVYGLLTSLAIANTQRPILEDGSAGRLAVWLKSGQHRPGLWGEGALGNLAPWLVWLRSADATTKVDREIESIVQVVVQQNQSGNRIALASPYYGFEEIVRHFIEHPLVHRPGGLARETGGGSSWVAELSLHLLVRTNLKGACRSVWPAYSRLAHRRFVMDESWHFCLRRAPGGVEETKIYPATYSWNQLRSDALVGADVQKVPEYLADRPWLLSMWWQVAPHRLDRDSLRVFVERLVPGWGS